MGQVLVGEIVFKLKADTDALIRNLRTAAAQVDRLNNSTQKASADQKKLADAFDETAATADSASDAVKSNSEAMKRNAAEADRTARAHERANRSGSMLAAMAAGLAKKLALVGIAVPLLAQAFNALALGAWNVISALGPLSGSLIAFPALIMAMVSTIGVLKGAFKQVGEGLKAMDSGDIAKINAQLGKMTPIARMATEAIQDFREALGASAAAEQGFLPGFTSGLRQMMPFVGMFRKEIFLLGRTMGDVAAKAGRVFSSVRFFRDFQRIGAMNRVVVENLGDSFINLAEVFRSVMSVGAPFVIFLANGVEKMTKMWQVSTSAARGSGALTGFFQRAAVAGSRFATAIGNIALGLKGISEAGGASRSLGFLDGLAKVTEKFKDFTNSARGQNSISDFFRKAQPALDAVKGLLGDVANMLGRVATDGSLVTIINQIRGDFLPAIAKLANIFYERLFPAFVKLTEAAGKFFDSISNTPLPILIEAVANMISALAGVASAVPIFANLIVTVLLLNKAIKTVTATAVFSGAVAGARALQVALTNAAVAARFQGLMGGLAALRGGLIGTAAAAKALRGALMLTGVGIALVALGAIFNKISGNADKLKEKVQELADIRREALRTKAGDDKNEYAKLLGNEARAMESALGKYKTMQAEVLDLRGKMNFGSAEMASEMKKRADDLDSASSAMLKRLGFTGKNAAKELEGVQKIIREDFQKTSMENAANAAIQAEGYRLLTGANLELAAATKSGREEQIALIASMSAAGRAAYDAVVATGDLVALYEKAGEGNAEGVGASMKQITDQMALTVKQAEDFSTNISKALKNGFDPAAVAELATKGPAVAGPMLAQLAATTDATLIGQFNSFAGKLRQQAVLVAEQARVMNQAINFKDDSLSKQLPLINQALTQIYTQGVTTFEGLVAKMKLNKTQADELRTALGAFGVTLAGLPPVDLKMEQARSEIESIAQAISKPGVKPVLADVKAALDKINAVRVAAGLKAIKPVDASIDAALAAIAQARAEAQRLAVMPIKAQVTYMVNSVPRVTGGQTGIQEADGGIVSYFANGGLSQRRYENHVAQIAPAGAMRVWAEPETGGEAYIPLSATKRARSLEILRQTATRMGVKVTEFANGSAISPTPVSPLWNGKYNPTVGLPRSGSDLAGRGAAADDLRDLINAYQAYLNKLEQAKRRVELLGDITKAKNDLARASVQDRAAAMDRLRDAQKALGEFDFAARTAKEIAGVEALIAVIERRRKIEDNMFERGDMSASTYMAILDKRIKAEEKYTDEWMALTARREQVQADRAAKQRQVAEEMTRHANTLLEIQNDYVKTDIEIRTSHAKASADLQRRYDADSLTALNRYNDQIDNLLSERHDTLTSWARIDEQAGPLTALPVEWINGNIREQMAQFQQWSDMLAGARSRGVGEDVIVALGLDAGPETLGQLQALAAATDAEIADLNALVLARSRQASAQVAVEARNTQTTLGTSLVDATRTYLEEATALRAEFNTDLAEINATLQTDLAKNLAEMQERVATENAQFAKTMTDFRNTMGGMGLDAGKAMSEAIAVGLANGLPAITDITDQIAALAQQATLAALAAQIAWGDVTRATTPQQPAGTRRFGDTVLSQPSVTPYVFDAGGVLSPGLSLAYNGTGRNEYILTGEQVANAIALAGKGGDGEQVIQVAIYLDGKLVTGVAKAEVTKGLASLRTELLNGRAR